MTTDSSIVIDVSSRLQCGEFEHIGAIDYVIETYNLSEDEAIDIVFLAESE